ncbi:MAG: hypothetical protein PHW04_08010 [Candidatus Wallbacteria bacterium]|nr:hypothetical protein [Candidatus Wallbacteria bacterium]
MSEVLSVSGKKILMLLPFLAGLLLTGCGKQKVRAVYPDFYPDPLAMFEEVWKQNGKPDTAVTKGSGEVSGKTLPMFSADKEKIRKMVNQGDFSEINNLVGSGNMDQAISKLKAMKSAYRDDPEKYNPFLVMHCSFYLSDLYHKKNSPEWKSEMDDVMKYYTNISENPDVKKVVQDMQDVDKFMQQFHPVNTTEVENNQ